MSKGQDHEPEHKHEHGDSCSHDHHGHGHSHSHDDHAHDDHAHSHDDHAHGHDDHSAEAAPEHDILLKIVSLATAALLIGVMGWWMQLPLPEVHEPAGHESAEQH